MKFDNEFKKAISQLSSSEKDKLILRLLKRDLVLVNQLYFQLLSDESADEKRVKLEKRILKRIDLASERFWSLGYLMMDMRDISGEITDHVRTTKDKFGEPKLQLLMLIEILKRNNTRIKNAKTKDSYKISIYIIARSFKILILISALDKDYFMEFRDELIELGKLITNNDILMQAAVHNGFDINWLTQAEIPEDIVAIHKNIRAMGFLK